MEELLQVGVITSTHGVRGEVKVFPTTDDPNRFKSLKHVLLDTGREKKSLEVQGVKFFKQFVILKFKGIDNINDIEPVSYTHLALNCPSSLRISENEKELSIVFHVCTDHLYHLVDLILFFSGTSFFQNVEDERHFLWSELDPFLVRTGDECHHNGSQRSPAFAGGLFGCKPDQLQFDRVHSLHGRMIHPTV